MTLIRNNIDWLLKSVKPHISHMTKGIITIIMLLSGNLKLREFIPVNQIWLGLDTGSVILKTHHEPFPLFP